MQSKDKPLPTRSQGDTIAIRVRRWRQRSPMWWLLPTSLGLFGCTLLAGALTLGVFGNRRTRIADRPAPSVNTTTGAATADAPGPTELPDVLANPTASAAKPLTIVLLGSDRRPGDGTVGRTDSLHVIALDPDGHGAGVLSLPRDLYVTIPDNGRDRINLVFAYGASQGEAGGAKLLRQTFADNFGIQVDHYVYIDFTAFVTVVDKLGGIDVNVPYTIDDLLYPDDNFGYEPFHLDAGPQHLDGATTLKYVRTRHETNDFYRARRQQQVMLAIRDRVLNFNLMPVLVSQIPTLWTTLAGGYKTDLTAEQAAALAWQVKDIQKSEIRLGVVDESATLSYVTPDGASVLVSDTAKVTKLVESVLYPAAGS